MIGADIAWVAVSTALVMLMTPALAFFYGGLVRRKNLVSTLSQCLAIFAVVSLIWAMWGYSLVFAPSIGGIGFVGSYVLLKIINRVTPLRVSPEEEEMGLDQCQHGEDAYCKDQMYAEKRCGAEGQV